MSREHEPLILLHFRHLVSRKYNFSVFWHILKNFPAHRIASHSIEHNKRETYKKYKVLAFLDYSSYTRN